VQLVLDWDGTVTERDTLWIALDAFGDRDVFARVEGALGRGELSYRELMELEFETVTASIPDVVAFLLVEARIRPGFRELVEEQRPLILSSGFHELIEPLLAREGVSVELRANRLDPRRDGWRVLWRDPERCPVCGDLCKRRSLPPGPLAYAGDGYSDRCAALAADRIFARDGLSDWLAGQGVPFEPFDDLYELAAALRRSGETVGGAVDPRTRRTGRK
jgi:2-hydroxy-3-keto-5-methylthiopentenyl-1-phosphate phosphatase